MASWPGALLDLCLPDKSASSAWLARCPGIVCYLIRQVFKEQSTLRIASKAHSRCPPPKFSNKPTNPPTISYNGSTTSIDPHPISIIDSPSASPVVGMTILFNLSSNSEMFLRGIKCGLSRTWTTFVYFIRCINSPLSLYRPLTFLIVIDMHTRVAKMNSREYAASAGGYHRRARLIFPLLYPPPIQPLSGLMKSSVKGR